MVTLAAALLTILAAQLLDFATFAEMMRRVGPDAEANPLVALLYSAYGLPIVAVAKIALVTLVAATVVITARRPSSRMTGVIIGVAIMAGLIGGLSNTIAIGVI
ncbi:MAG: hypothetical protein FIA92_08695 [Chloroflexi bacterium]|nr:hypothetical protein [Chloroflexota bacterium]